MTPLSVDHARRCWKNQAVADFDKENRKALKKKRGLFRSHCLDCGYLNAVDVQLMIRVLNERQGTRAGRLARWADRQIEEGSRLTGRHAAAEAARLNRENLSRHIQGGIPCAMCGMPLMR